MAIYSWSKSTGTANANSDATINWAEGQSPSSVNDSARNMMAGLAQYRDDTAGLTTAGTSTAYTVTSNQVFTTLALMDGASFAIVPHTTSGAAPTLSVDTLTAKPIRFAPSVVPETGAFLSGVSYRIRYVNANNEFVVVGFPAVLPASMVITATLAASSVTYAKIQNVTNARLLGNFTGGAAAPSEYSLGNGLSVATTVLSSANAYLQSGFKNLSIKVASNTTVTVAADFVVMYDGTNYRAAVISGTTNLSTNGAVNTLDTGTIAIDSWYFIWAISNGTTDGTLASLSSTAPTMPSGYTFKARIGAVQTIHASAILYGTWQFGNRAQYVQGLAGGTPTTTTTPGPIASGSVGTPSIVSPTLVAKSVAGNGLYVPTTASHIHIIGNTNYKAVGAGVLNIAPSQAYSGTNNGPAGSNGIPHIYSGDGASSVVGNFWMLLESTSVSCATITGSMVSCAGWQDNI